MHKNKLKFIATILFIIITINFFVMGPIGTIRVSAGFLDNHKDTILTGVKGLLMVLIMHLIYRNTGEENEEEDLVTSTIQEGLGLGKDTSEDNEDTEVSSESSEVEIIPVESKDEIKEKEVQFSQLVNEIRKSKDISEIELKDELIELARVKASDMDENEYFDHTSSTYGSIFDMLDSKGVEYTLASENIVRAETIEEGFQELIASEKHRENILDPRYNQMGIGIVKGGPFGLIIVQILVEK